MITTVTAATAATAATSGLAMSSIAIAALLALLICKEIVVSSAGDRAPAISRALNVAILPLLLAFLLIAGARLADVLK